MTYKPCLVLLLLLAVDASAAEFHAAVDGTANGNGSAEQPWDLTTALSSQSGVKPGDTLWLHGGTYRGGFTSELTGEPARPIVVRGMPGERVTLDTKQRDERDRGTLYLQGADTVYRDFEVTCSQKQRVTELPGSWPANIRRGSVDVRGSRLSLINLVVHDEEVGFGFWSEGEGGEISGCLIYNNGWKGPDRAHGHGIYAQNARGTKRIRDNVVFHQFAYGVHVYGSDKASLKGFEIEGNIIFNNGCWSGEGDRQSSILVGGGSPAERIAIRDNVAVGGTIRLGYPWGTTNEDAIVTGNYCDAGFVLRDFRKATVKNNTFAAGSNVVVLEGAETLLLNGLDWDRNDLYISEGRWGETAVVEHGKSQGRTFAEWQRDTRCDANSTFTKGLPDKLRVIVRPNAHEPGRANVAVINPQKLPSAEIDLSQVLRQGQAFRIVSVKDFFGEAIASGTYDGQPVRVPMKPIAAPTPIGLANAQAPVTEPEFAAFVVLSGN